MATKKQAVKKECTVIARYAFKTNKVLNGHICTLVCTNKIVKGETVITEHKVWTHTNGCASSCDCEGFEKSHGRRKCYHIKEVEAIEAARKAELLEQVNAELAKVNATPATAEELAATQARVLLPNSVDQIVYFIQLNRRSDEYRKQQLEAESKRRTSAPLNSNQGFSLLKTA